MHCQRDERDCEAAAALHGRDSTPRLARRDQRRLCLLIACSIGGIKIKGAVKDTAILFVPMLPALLIVILFPQRILWLPRLLMAQYVK
jgi:hypothetical protein